MDVKERRPYCSLTKGRRDKERRYTGSSGDSEECRVPTQQSYSSSETLKAFDHDSSRLLYGGRVKDMVHREADEFSHQGQNFNLRQLGICEPPPCRGPTFCADMVGLPHRGYSVGAGSDMDGENEGVMSPERAMRLWSRGVKAGRSSCLSSRSNSPLTLTDTEHENKSDSENAHAAPLSVIPPPPRTAVRTHVSGDDPSWDGRRHPGMLPAAGAKSVRSVRPSSGETARGSRDKLLPPPEWGPLLHLQGMCRLAVAGGVRVEASSSPALVQK
ncbi:hypothetical protein cypCar-00021882 [Arapaima gigas]